jgi:hypothetical protein
MSSNFCGSAPGYNPRHGTRLATAVALWSVVWAVFAPWPARADTSVRFSDVISITGDQLTLFDGYPIERLALLACQVAACVPIPFQIDERDPEGRWVLDHGAEPNADTPPGVLDANDALLFMAADAGDRVERADLLGRLPALEIMISDPLAGSRRWVYLVAFAGAAPRAPTSYVAYDASTDRVRGDRVSLGFHQGLPNYLAITDGSGTPGSNLLDRLKVRASATFLWGLIHFSRSEDDLSTQFVGWRQGPIRVIRCQRQWVRLGWGIRSPTFGSYTYFYRDFAELPVGLRLNFPATYFFGSIVVRVVLDFRDLRGWSVLTPSLSMPLVIDGTMTAQKAALNGFPDAWFALLAPQLTLVQTMDVSPSLASVRRRLLYREDGSRPEPPESVPGEEPGVGYQLDQWESVGAGAHSLQSVSYALPPAVDVRRFMAARATPLQVSMQVRR